MSGFSAGWLRLREPCDARSRSEELVRALRARLPPGPLQAVDLGTGTAANIRYLAPRLEGTQSWLAVDNDAALLGLLPLILKGPNFDCRLAARQLDLATGLGRLPWTGCRLVTASALLDLVSVSWLQGLAAHCAAAGAAALFALNYDGRMLCSPREPDDDWLCELVNRHQHGDKGFGPALGPQGTERACALFGSLGFRTRVAASDWLIEPGEHALQQELLDGWVKAALELVPGDAQRIAAWAARRRAHLAAGDSRLRVGHHDFIAWPTAAGG